MSQQLSPTNTSKEDSLERKILAMASLDLAVAIQSMNTIENVSIHIISFLIHFIEILVFIIYMLLFMYLKLFYS